LTIKEIGKPYTIISSIFNFIVGQDPVATWKLLLISIFATSTTAYTVRLYSSGFYVTQFGIQGILFDPRMINNIKKKMYF
jgi:hypothetical protein